MAYKYTKDELDVMKQALIEYDYLARQINHEIKNGASMRQLLYYLQGEFEDIDITNCDLKSTFKYIDFNYGTLNCSILESDVLPVTFSKYIEVWNDKATALLFENIHINELKNIIKESEK